MPDAVVRTGARPEHRPGGITFAGGVTTENSYPIGDVTADLRRNGTGTPPPVALFETQSEIGRATALEARFRIGLTRWLAVEVAGTYGVPTLTVRVTADTEVPGESLAEERISQFGVNVSGVMLLGPPLGRRARLYAIAGGGYLRQLHESRLLVDTGRTIHAGGGVEYWLRGGTNQQHPLGVRGEARFVHRTGGIDYEDASRSFPAMSALVFVGF